MTNISCLHVIPWVNHKIIELEDLGNEYYNVDTFRKVYFEVVHSLPEADFDHKKRRYNCSTSKTQKKHE
jgi:hypothetical protein